MSEAARISDHERREIAARLRRRRHEMDGERPPQDALLCASVYLAEIAKAVKCGTSGALFYRLADLIDRPTCSIRRDDPASSWGVCSNCHALVEMETAVSDATEYLPTRSCPNCGAEVMR